MVDGVEGQENVEGEENRWRKWRKGKCRRWTMEETSAYMKLNKWKWMKIRK